MPFRDIAFWSPAGRAGEARRVRPGNDGTQVAKRVDEISGTRWNVEGARTADPLYRQGGELFRRRQ